MGTALGWTAVATRARGARTVCGAAAVPDGLAPARLGGGIVNLPNAVSLARLVAVPLGVWLVLRRELVAAFGVFAAAGLSDALDGWLARRRGPTALGAVLDVAADKALLVSMYVALAAIQALPAWIAVLVISRDLFVVGGVLTLWRLGQSFAVRPLMISKLGTALQIVLAAAALLLNGVGLAAPWLLDGLTWLVALTTVASAAAYTWKGARSL